MKVICVFIISLFICSCSTKSDSERLKEYGDFLNKIDSYEYDVTHQVYRSFSGKTSTRIGTAYFSIEPQDTLLGIKYYTSIESNGRKYKSFYDGDIQTGLSLNDSIVIYKTPALLPPNRRMTNPIITSSIYSIKKWIERNSRDSIFNNLRLKDTIIDNKKCDLFTYQIDFRDHGYWHHIPENKGNNTTNTVNIAFSKESKLPVYLYYVENFNAENFQITKVRFSDFHEAEYNDEKLSIESVPDYFHGVSGRKMLPKYSNAPNFILPQVDGDSIALSELRGKYVLIEFSYLGCGACIKSIPKLNELQKIYADTDLKIYGINLYSSNPAKISDFYKKFGIEYPILWSDSDFFPKYYYINAAPTLYLIDDTGKIIYSSIGFKEDELKAELMEIFGT